MIAVAVKIAPLQKAGEFIRKVQDSPSKKIDAKHKRSVESLVRKQRRRIMSVQLHGVTVYNTTGSLAKLAEALWFGDAVQRYISSACLDIQKVYVIGRQILESDWTVFLTFANGWLLDMFRSIASGYATQLCRDVTTRACTVALNWALELTCWAHTSHSGHTL